MAEEEKNYYYSLKQVRKIVFNDGVSISLLQNLVKADIIPCVRLGGRILIPIYWVEEQIAHAQKHTTT